MQFWSSLCHASVARQRGPEMYQEVMGVNPVVIQFFSLPQAHGNVYSLSSIPHAANLPSFIYHIYHYLSSN